MHLFSLILQLSLHKIKWKCCESYQTSKLLRYSAISLTLQTLSNTFNTQPNTKGQTRKMPSSAPDTGRFANKSKAYAFVDDGKKRDWMINEDGIMRRMDDDEQKEFKRWYEDKYGGGMRDYNKLIKDIMERRNKAVRQAMQMGKDRRDQAMLRHKDVLKQFGLQGLLGISSEASSSSSGQGSSASSLSQQQRVGMNGWPGGRVRVQRNVNIFVNGKRVAGNGGDSGHQNQNQVGSGSGAGSQEGTSGSDT
jgi:hypothetical protein